MKDTGIRSRDPRVERIGRAERRADRRRLAARRSEFHKRAAQSFQFAFETCAEGLLEAEILQEMSEEMLMGLEGSNPLSELREQHRELQKFLLDCPYVDQEDGPIEFANRVRQRAMATMLRRIEGILETLEDGGGDQDANCRPDTAGKRRSARRPESDQPESDQPESDQADRKIARPGNPSDRAGENPWVSGWSRCCCGTIRAGSWRSCRPVWRSKIEDANPAALP